MFIITFTVAFNDVGAGEPNGQGSEVERVNVLIAFENVPRSSEAALVRAFGGKVDQSFSIVPALAATLPAAAVEGLSRHSLVTVVELNRM